MGLLLLLAICRSKPGPVEHGGTILPVGSPSEPRPNLGFAWGLPINYVDAATMGSWDRGQARRTAPYSSSQGRLDT